MENTARSWTPVKAYEEILFDRSGAIARITINRPRVHNAFTPLTVQEMIDAFCPIANRVGLKFYTPGGCNTGDGINMGAWAGAALRRTVAAPMIHQFCFGSFTFLLDAFMMS